MTEVWKDIPGYEGHYMVSDFGRIKSIKFNKETILKHTTNGKPGHRKVMLCLNGKVKWLFVHRIVMLAFVGECPDGLLTCHNNGDSSDNRLTNLRYDTYAANSADSDRHGTRPRGSSRSNSKLTESSVVEIRKRLTAGDMQKDIAADFGVSRSTIYNLKEGISWNHV